MGIETLPSSERLQEDVQLIKEWMSKQPHLPKVEDDEWLGVVLRYNKYRLEKTKSKIDSYFSFRTKYPEILRDRDPTSPEILQAIAAYKVIFADRLTKNGELVHVCQIQADTSIFDMKSVLKMFFMHFDALHLANDGHTRIIGITDCQYLSYTHFLKILPWFKLAVEIFFNAYSARMTALHVINTPAHLDKVVNILKGFLPQKIADRFYIYSSPEQLCKVIDEDVLCSDYGGRGPSLAEYDRHSIEQLQKYRQWFLEQNDICAREELRRITDDKEEDMNGSFRKLAVD